jgi:hypothetical protein
MRPGARIASLILVAFSCLAPISSQAAHSAPGQATEPDWANLPYFRHDYGGWFRIWTNQNTFDNGVRIINGGDPGSMFNPYPGPTVEELDPLNDFQGLWSTKCQKVKEQTFKTSRKIYLPGDADLLQVSLGAYSYSSENKPSPVDSVEILVNGIGVHKVKATKANPIPFANSERTIEDVTDEAHLIFGLNTFTVIAHKKATKKAAGWCTGDNKFAVSAEVYGEFLADLEVTRELGIHHTDGFDEPGSLGARPRHRRRSRRLRRSGGRCRGRVRQDAHHARSGVRGCHRDRQLLRRGPIGRVRLA